MKYLTLVAILITVNSCSYPEMIRDELVFSDNFESGINSAIDGGATSYFNDSNVLGDFNNDGFTIHLENIGDHDYIFVSLDLYIHGSWDGNSNGFEKNDRPDLWIIDLKPDMELYNNASSEKFITSFSNSPCWPNYCLIQSYPENFPFDNNPKTGHFAENLDSKCNNNFFGGPTTLYKIEKGFSSSGKSVLIRFYDELYQPNAIDNNGNVQSKCDESWSVDNLKIRAIKYK